jgi:hypothetical protein
MHAIADHPPKIERALVQLESSRVAAIMAVPANINGL